MLKYTNTLKPFFPRICPAKLEVHLICPCVLHAVKYSTESPRFTIAMSSLKPYLKPNPFLHVLDRDTFQHIAKVTPSGSDTYIKTYFSVKINKLNKEKEKKTIMQSLRNSSFNGSKSRALGFTVFVMVVRK